MTALRIFTQDLFDGTGWRGPATVTVDGGRIAELRLGADAGASDLAGAALLPGLVDFGVTATGYVESPLASDPFAPESAFASMCLRFGVTTIVDVNNNAAGLAHLRALHRRAQGPRVLAAGARLSTAPASRSDLLVDRATAPAAIEANRHAGACLVSLGAIDDGALAAAIRDRAAELGAVVVTRADAASDLPGLSFESSPPALDGPFQAPQLEAVARWTVEGLLRSHDAAMAAPFLPYARNFARIEGFVGRRIGRGILERYYGERAPVGAAERERDAADAARRGRCLASSAAGAAGLVPGRSLWAELGRLRRAGIESADVLFSATGVAADLFGAGRDERGLGRIEPGAPADLLVLDGHADAPARDRDPCDLWQALAHVVVGGHLIATAPLAGEVDLLIADAMKEPV